MAVGDITIYDEAMAYMYDGGWAGTDNIAIDLILATSTPADTDATPDPTTYNLATSTEGEQILTTWATFVSQVGGALTMDDSDATVVWAQGGGNSTTVRWALIYNTTATTPHANPGIAFLDLGSNRDLTAGSLTVTWNASGIITGTKSP
jgi:uncharacterized NAD(P)/FAD-binding protein YdhS